MTTSSFRRMAGPALGKVAVAALLASASGTGASLAGEAAGVTVQDAWMRFIVASRPAGGYFTITNDSGADRKLVGASAPDCGMVMMHKSVSENGTDKMVKVASVDVPAHGSAMFAPGGFHLMCMKPNGNVEPDKTVPVTLKFADGDTVSADFEVYGPEGK